MKCNHSNPVATGNARNVVKGVGVQRSSGPPVPPRPKSLPRRTYE